MQESVSAQRPHIAFFGIRNAGKSSLVNAVTGQNLSIVSEIAGTTTDPVSKAMELLPAGPVVIIDTPGIDDAGALGEERVKRTLRILDRTDLAVLVVSSADGLQEADLDLIALLKKRHLPFLVASTKADLTKDAPESAPPLPEGMPHIRVSALTGEGIHELKETIAAMLSSTEEDRPLVSDLVDARQTVIMVVPIDSSAPKGRLILPQQMVLRELLDTGAIPVVTKDTELYDAFAALSTPPALVITDSQVFGKVNQLTPAEVPLTSFSMILARYKGILPQAVSGARLLRELPAGSRILIAEGCTHHRQCEDIGTVKIPKWLKEYTGKEMQYFFSSGNEFPEDLTAFDMIIHCGGCMQNEKEMKSRYRMAADADVPITNYGIAIAQMHGILERAVKLLL